MPPVTLETIARLSNVSRGAVSLVLRDPEHPRFSRETRQRILEVARRLDYVPNRMASGLRRGQSRFLSLVVPWNTPELLDTAELEANRAEFGMMIQFTMPLETAAERRAIALALERRVDGLIWLPADPHSDHRRIRKRIQSTGTHVVLVEAGIPGFTEADLVAVDYENTMREVLHGMAAAGYEKLVYVTRGLKHPLRDQRARAFSAVVEKLNVASEFVPSYRSGNYDQLFACCSTGRTAFFCDSDWFGLDVIEMARRNRLEVPERVGAVSLGDMLVGGSYRVCEICRPTLSAIRRPSGDMARRAVELLIGRVSGKRSGPGTVEQLSTCFLQRDSTLPFPESGRLGPPAGTGSPSRNPNGADEGTEPENPEIPNHKTNLDTQE